MCIEGWPRRGVEARAAVCIEESLISRESAGQGVVGNRNTTLAVVEKRLEYIAGVKRIFPVAAWFRGIRPGPVRALLTQHEMTQSLCEIAELARPGIIRRPGEEPSGEGGDIHDSCVIRSGIGNRGGVLY